MGTSVMRESEVSFRMMQKMSLPRAFRFAAIALGVGLVMAAGPVQAGGDEEDDSTFEEKLIDGIMRGIGGTNMENRGIDYRERSPLVVPPRLDLPPPASASADVKVPNWPKDPDVQRQKAAAAARKKAKKDPIEAARPLTPDEMNVGRTAVARKDTDPAQPGGANNNPMLSPSQLGYSGGLSLFSGNKAESAPFTGEPTRETLTQPPPGYQTPSSSYAYGTGPRESLNKQTNIMTGKEE
jgi:hypothetical protein